MLIPVPSLLRSLLSEHLDPGYAAAAEKRGRTGAPRTPRARVVGWLWQALAAMLVATVFAAAVAQARSVAPGVRAAQQVLADSVKFDRDAAARLASAAQRAVDSGRRRRSGARSLTTPRDSGCSPVSTR